MSDRALITDEELHAFIDGELDPLRAADVAVLLQYHPELQEKVNAFRADKALLTAAYGPLLDRPVTEAWNLRIARGRRRTPFPISRRAMFAVAASAAGVLVASEVYLRLWPHNEDALIHEAMAAREEGRGVGSAGMVDRAEADRAVKAALAMDVKTPDMSKYGFALVRYHVSRAAGGGRAVVLDYQDDQHRVFTLYLRHSTGEERFDMAKRGAVRVCVWQDEVLGAVMLAEVNAGEMLRLATLAYAGLSA